MADLIRTHRLLLRDAAREAYDLLVIEQHPSVDPANEAITRAHIENTIWLAMQRGERSARRLVDLAVDEARRLPSSGAWQQRCPVGDSEPMPPL